MKKKTRVSDIILKTAIWFFSFLTIGILLWILGFVLYRGLPHISWKFLTDVYKPGIGKFGILPMIKSTIYIVLLAIAIAAPIGIFAAIYLVEYSKEGIVVRIIRFATESLAGIPSVIYGLFGLIFFVNLLHFRYSLLSGALTVSILVLPTIIRTTEEALKTVPVSYREGSLALGATKLTTIIKIILPSAIPGILTAIILSIGRIVGETAAIMFTAGTALNVHPELMKSSRTLSIELYLNAKEGMSLDRTFAIAAVLLIIVAVINFLANRIAANIKKITISH